MDCNRGTTSHQCVGVESSTIGIPVFLEGEDGHLCADSNGQQGSNSPHKQDRGPSLYLLSQIAQELWSWCLEHRVLPHAEHLPGKENVLANWESCHLSDSSDWQLLSSVFKSLQSSLGPFSIDLFASRANHQLPEYCSWKPDPTAVAVDAFSMPWSSERSYLFPPFNLVRRSLTKIRMEAVTSTCLIALAWPAQSWYPQLLEMLMKKPIMLSPEEGLLLSPELTSHPLILEDYLSLAT